MIGDLRSYRKADSIVFFKTKDSFGGLSNMASGYPLFINGVEILTSEALYQACRFPHNADIQKLIFDQISPMHAKDISKKYEYETRPDWMDIRHKIMRWCLRVKLAQNYDSFGQLLLSTKNASIVELSYKDDFWGAIPSKSNSDELVGKNVLGRLLMELRDLLHVDHEKKLPNIPTLKVHDFLILGENVDIVSRDDSKGINNQLF
ncbi:NADAR family protein [Marinomonas sp. FW-1]|uniref:NADAR family protein n=1 Tax=Marinomonas sp. FW-1 TaxID=2071621 RepID=UPI0010C08214|nr:NADAR family protein [Marinomonas sp. FW-1]